MPPTFFYFIAFIIWIPLALIVWIIAGIRALTATKRPAAKELALAMAGTFPGVFAFQLAAAPVVLIILLGIRIVGKMIEPGSSGTTENPIVITVSITGALLAFIMMAVMSLAGFYEGWRMGRSWAKGKTLREAWKDGPTSRLVRRVLSFHASG